MGLKKAILWAIAFKMTFENSAVSTKNNRVCTKDNSIFFKDPPL